ncbi:MAG: deaminase [Nitrospiraceae bacterium]
MIDKWDQRMMDVAYVVGSWSKDPCTKVGAVLVSSDRRQVSWGFNGLPRGIEDSPERLNDKELKNALTVHAEMNALLNSPVDVAGWTLYCTKFPCISKGCAQGIIQRRIVRVVCPTISEDSDWAPDQKTAFRLLQEAGIYLDLIERMA